VKLYVVWDMEGTSGLFHKEQAWYWDPGVSAETAEEGKRLLMADVDSATAAALDAGVDELIVCDTHHGGGNVRVEQLIQDRRVTYHGRSTATMPDGSRRVFPGLDETVDGLLLLGHHAKAGTPDAFLPHAQSLAWADIRINGQSVGEIGIEACYAGYWDVPLVMVQGDEAGCREAQAQFPGVVTAPVKHALHAELAGGMSAEEGRRLTASRVRQVVQQLRAGTRPAPFRPALPLHLTLRLTTPQDADALQQRSGAQRMDEHTIECRLASPYHLFHWTRGAGVL
jgi:D-amino peptidase